MMRSQGYVNGFFQGNFGVTSFFLKSTSNLLMGFVCLFRVLFAPESSVCHWCKFLYLLLISLGKKVLEVC